MTSGPTTSEEALAVRICDPQTHVEDLSDSELALAKERWKRNAMGELTLGAFLIFGVTPLLVTHFLLHRYFDVNWLWIIASSLAVFFCFGMIASFRIDNATSGGLPANWFDELRVWGVKQQNKWKEDRKREAEEGRLYGRILVVMSVISVILAALAIAALLTVPERATLERALRSELADEALNPAGGGLFAATAGQYVRDKIDDASINFIDLLSLQYHNYWVFSVLLDKNGKVVAIGAYKQVHFFGESNG